MTTAYLRRILNGETPSAQEWNDHLIAFNARFDGITSGTIAAMRTEAGETSYQVLARRTLETVPDARAILDIGCGDGFLMRKLKQMSGRPLELVGIDLSQAAIDLAASLLPEAMFVCGDARTADLGALRFDAAVAHLSLMIASQPELILAQARRELKDDGVMLMVMEDLPLHPDMGVLVGAGVRALRAKYAAFAPAIPERGLFESDEELQAMFRSAGFANAPEIERFQVCGRYSLREAWAHLQRIYPFGLLEDDDLASVREAVEAAAAERTGEDGKVPWTLGVRLVVVRV